MKAIVYSDYGSPDVLRLKEVARPVPKNNEILIRVKAASVNFGDLMARSFRAVTPRGFNMIFPFWLITKMTLGWRKPRIKILGNELAGDVESVGRDVKRFKPGDRVFGYAGQSFGAYAECLCLNERAALAQMPAGLAYEEAAAIPYGAVMEEARAFFEEYAAAFPDDPVILDQWLARIIKDKGPYDKGAELAEKIRKARRSPSSIDPNQNVAELYWAKGDKDKADDVFGKSFMENQVSSLANNLINYANFWIGKSANTDSAPAMAEKALAIQPDNGSFIQPAEWRHWIALSVVQEKKGNTAEAVKSMEKAIELAPASVKDHYKKKLEKLKADMAKK